MIVAEDNEAAGGAAAQTADIARSARVKTRNGRRPGDAPEGTVFMSRTKSFTRRSRELPPNLARTWEAHAERYVIEPRRGIGYTTVAEDFRLDPVELFGRSAPLTLEIGSGTGEQIVAAAAAHPDRDYLALEVWVPGIAKLVSKAVEAGVDNIRVLEADAAQALPFLLADASLDEVWTFFPDPWRKARHHKRRLVSDEFAREVARVLRDGGVWRLATDWDNYAWQMRDVIEACPLFVNPHLGQRPDPEDPEPERGGFAPRYEGRVVTHFETRGIDAGRRAHDIVGVRVPRK
ncbi:tRNA (guanosine(46)-N7)-methyltransferase TrmB [uncultured Actinomyces sp.]|uniref:tRNA (guanosine(46)-N7)-methyltransferase TrmB n=1 Tax=uncultured Actinomyces sp. TaxID=249061 RepID=UPI0028EBE073|nr:tRNA (guanosine(46)-N7)-methyltransferase TrmB [uncultured Actinomyces sp.]